MKKLTSVIALLAITACNKAKSPQGKTDTAKTESTAVKTVDGSTDATAKEEAPWMPPAGEVLADRQLFNLAQYVKESASLEKLHGMVAEGNAYLFFGEQKFFRAETNLIIDANAEEGSAKKGVYADYFLDTYALGKKLPNDGRTVDIGASATLSTPSNVEAHVRFLGDDKWKVTVAGTFDQSFMRDIPFELPLIPVPGVSLVVGGKVGGEIGVRGDLGARIDNAAQIVFIPRVNMQVKVNGGVKLIELLKAEAEGALKLIQVSLYTAANLGSIPNASYSYGNIGVEAGELSAIDGKIDLVAGIGYDGILPGGIDKIILSKLLSSLGFGTVKDLTWRYTLYDPKPVIVKDIPGFGTSFMKFYKQPTDRNDCKVKATAISSKLNEVKTNIQALMEKEQGLDKKVSESNIKTFDELLGRVGNYCM